MSRHNEVTETILGLCLIGVCLAAIFALVSSAL